MTSLLERVTTFNHNRKIHRKLVTSVVYIQKNNIFVVTNLQISKF